MYMLYFTVIIITRIIWITDQQ